MDLCNVLIWNMLVLHGKSQFNTSVKCLTAVCNQFNLVKKNNSLDKRLKGGNAEHFHINK